MEVEKSDSTINSIADFAFKYINQTNKSVFLTGKAGTGKTTFLKELISHTPKNAIIVAPTGIAAINAGGVTIHSQFGVPFGAYIPDSSYKLDNYSVKINTPNTLIKHLYFRESKRKIIQELELLIIDEVSMLRADLLDVIDFVLRTIRKRRSQPFGGVQVLFIGDLMQLPPVVKDDEWDILKHYYKSPFFFEAQVLKNNQPVYIELEKIYRQKDHRFIDLLNHIRHNQLNQDDIALLNNFYKPTIKKEELVKTITLTTHNFKADKINHDSLKALSGKSFKYKAIIDGEFNESAYPVNEELDLKVGAQVMFIRNDISGEGQFFNGKIAYISKLTQDEIWVDFNDGFEPIKIEPYQWKNIQYQLNEVTYEIEEKDIGEFKQYPIKLAWAITIHKSQGLTFEKAILDLNQAFTAGQIYVALSRLKSLDGLVLTQPVSFNLFNQDENLVQFSDLKWSEKQIQQGLEQDKVEFMQIKVNHIYDFSLLSNKVKSVFETWFLNEDSNFFNKEQFEWANEILTELKLIYQHSISFINQLNSIFEKKDTQTMDIIIQRNLAAKNYFTPYLKKLSKELLTKLENLYEEFQSEDFITDMLEAEHDVNKQLIQLEKSSDLLNYLSGNIELNNFSSKSIINQQERVELIRQLKSFRIDHKKRKKSSKKKTKKISELGPIDHENIIESKPKKVNSKQLSYDLYKQGLRIEEIAKERNMAMSTIEGHLVSFLSLGGLNIHDFVSDEKIQQIKLATQKFDSETGIMSFIKQELGDSISYSEIKFALEFLKK